MRKTVKKIFFQHSEELKKHINKYKRGEVRMRAWFARFGGIVGAWGFLTIFNFIFDDVLYPLAIFKWGALRGGGGMAILATIQCLVLVIWYEKAQRDWLGVNVINTFRSDMGLKLRAFFSKPYISRLGLLLKIILYIPSQCLKFISWAIKKNNLLTFITLNIVQDPFVTLIFLRRGRFNGLHRKDWLIFTSAVIFSNTYWIARNTALIEVVKRVWSWF